MVFSSISFIFLFFPLFFLFDSLARIRTSISWRNGVLIFVSLVFYTWGEASYVLLLIGLSLFNYYAGNFIFSCKKSRFYFVIFVSINLAVLFGFKYALWVASFILPALREKSVAIPLGISFFTFHAISYLIDIYRQKITPAKTALDFFTYFCMFPHLVAGPIVRYSQVSKDIVTRGPSKELFSFGMYRFLVGLNKKVLVANIVSDLAESAFTLSGTGNLFFFDAWIGIIAYSIQIYSDFSGYSDMAIGLAAMAGFHFEENFYRPYSSSSLREFWKRWHISLSSWLRDYLYIPLGGE